MSEIRINNEYLPSDTKNILPHQISEKEFKNFNFALIYNLPNISKKNGELKIRINESLENYKWDNQFVFNIRGRIEKLVESFHNIGFLVEELKSTLSWRMVIGLGASHPQETSMTLHHIYGIPYIPGSAIKGVTRHWVILKEFDKLNLPIKQISCFVKILESADIEDKDKSKRECEEKFKTKSKDETIIPDEKLYNFLKNNWKEIELFQNIFGTQEKAGEVIFFDAYPAGEIKLKMDVMTPHYEGYYSGKTPPADWQSPNPIKFLTIEKTKFRFYLASKSNNLLPTAEKWLKDALQNFGIGAKTSIGYGYFELGVNNNENTCF